MDYWQRISEFPAYEISRDGDVANIKTGRILNTSISRSGLIKVNLRKDGITYTRTVAKLVALAFLDIPPPKYVIIYNDFNPLNVSAENIQWKPRWFAQERLAQSKRTQPMRRSMIMKDSTGEIFKDSLECANAIGGIEKYIVLCAGHPEKRYLNSTYSWVRN
jgi:hypothetical protein